MIKGNGFNTCHNPVKLLSSNHPDRPGTDAQTDKEQAENVASRPGCSLGSMHHYSTLNKYEKRHGSHQDFYSPVTP